MDDKAMHTNAIYAILFMAVYTQVFHEFLESRFELNNKRYAFFKSV